MGRTEASDLAFLFALDLVIFLFWSLQWPHYICLSPWPALPGAHMPLCLPFGEEMSLGISHLGQSLWWWPEVPWSFLILTPGEPGDGEKSASHTCLPQAPGPFLRLCSSLRRNVSLDWGPCGYLLGQRRAAVLEAWTGSQMCLTGMRPTR